VGVWLVFDRRHDKFFDGLGLSGIIRWMWVRRSAATATAWIGRSNSTPSGIYRRRSHDGNAADGRCVGVVTAGDEFKLCWGEGLNGVSPAYKRPETQPVVEPTQGQHAIVAELDVKNRSLNQLASAKIILSDRLRDLACATVGDVQAP
jgi:hypothetical protein